jgi:hypothetical protein
MMSMGTCFGKFNRNGKFRLAITSLEYIAQFAKVLSASLFYPAVLCHISACSTKCG